jgi:hypothetical protein
MLWFVRIALVCCAAFMGIVAQASIAHGQGISECSQRDITGGGACSKGLVKLSPKDQALLNQKTRLAEEFTKVRLGLVSYAQYQRDLQAYVANLPAVYRDYSTRMTITRYCVALPSGGCAPSQVLLNVTQQKQATTYYCGPATASEILKTLGYTDSQSTLAGSTFLHTDALGETPWNPAYMPQTLNDLQNHLYYVAQNGSASGVNSSTWISDLVEDSYTFGQPIAGNTVEYWGSGVYLTGHTYFPQSDFPLYHWIAIRGYTNNGQDTAYADSISGDTQFWPWATSTNIPPYSTISSSSMYTLLTTMGWVW